MNLLSIRARMNGILKLNSDKASQLLNWVPRLDFKTTVKLTASWYKSFILSNNVSESTETQIRFFFDQ